MAGSGAGSESELHTTTLGDLMTTTLKPTQVSMSLSITLAFIMCLEYFKTNKCSHFIFSSVTPFLEQWASHRKSQTFHISRERLT